MKSEREVLYDQIRQLHENVKEVSLKNYLDRTVRIKKLLKIESDDLEEILKFSPEELCKKIINSDNELNTKRNIINFIYNLCKKLKINEEIFKIYEETWSQINNEYEKLHMTNELINSRKDAWLTWKEIEKVFNLIKPDSFESCMEKLIVGLYTRLNGYVCRLDFADMKVIDHSDVDEYDKNKINYTYHDSKLNLYVIVLNAYKTEKKYGKITIEVLDDDLHNLLDKWFEEFNTNEEWLLVSVVNHDKPLSANSLSKQIRRIFLKYTGKPITNQILRQIKETDNVNDNQDKYSSLNLLEKKNMHNKLMHSFEMAHQYVKK